MWIALVFFDVGVKRFVSLKHEDKVPHMGVEYDFTDSQRPLQGLHERGICLFRTQLLCAGQRLYGCRNGLYTSVQCALHKDNYYATQFHPEKSGSVGERILQNFLDL